MPTSEQVALLSGGQQGPSLDLRFDLPGQTSIDPRIAFTRASTATYFDATGTMREAAANVPRLDYGPTPGGVPLGLLIEEARTNCVQNPRGEGAQIGVWGGGGSGGTGWIVNVINGTAPTVSTAGFGVEDGIPYVDVRVVSTAPGYISFDEHSITSGSSSGYVYYFSGYLRMSGGSPANVVGVNTDVYFSGGGGNSRVALNYTASSLAAGRFAVPTQATTGAYSFRCAVSISYTAGMDITLRFGAQQLELGAFATSLILPPVGSPGVSTRAADVATMPVGSWFNFTAGAVVTEVMFSAPSTPAGVRQGLYIISDGSYNNCISAFSDSGGNSVFCQITAGSTNQISGQAKAGYTTSPISHGLSWSAASEADAVSGISHTQAGVAIPVGVNILRLGQGAAPGGWYLNGHLGRFRYWPHALSVNQLVSLTS